MQTIEKVGRKYTLWVAGAVLLAALMFLAGCQGVSAGANVQQQQYGSLNLPQTLYFGNVTAGNSATLTLTATNPGPGSVTVNSATISTQYFSLTSPSLPVTIASGQTATISIMFSPNATGVFNATLTVSSNASDAQTSVALSGAGSSVTTPPGQLSVSPGTIPIGNVTVGSSGTGSGSLQATSEPVTVTDASSNSSAFTISGLSLPVTIPAGSSVPFTVTFTPTSTGSASATLSFTSNAEVSPTTGTATGTGIAVVTAGQLSVSPGTIPVGSVVVGTSGTASGSLVASGAAVTVTADGSNNSAFSISGLSFPVTIPAGSSVPFTVTFTPTSTGSASATLSFTSNAQTSPSTGTATGTGTAAVTAGQLSVSPGTIPVGSVVVGTSGTASGSLVASGAAVTVTADGSNNSAFSISGLSFPVKIPAGDSVPFTVTFTPTSTGSSSATLSFTSNAQTSPSTGTGTGTGTAAPTYDVSLSWNPSSSSDISGYNIYRALYQNSACGSFSKINPSLNAGTSYKDTVVVDGTAYCYATTAVNTSNEESSYSNIVSDVQIPAP